MMMESFAKLSTVLAETKSDSKSDWPKFSGVSKKFCDWYLSIMTQVSLPPWNVLYDSTTNDVVATTSNTTLNGKLYSKIILWLEGKALKHAMSRKHLCANGLLLLSELNKRYKPTNVPEVIAAKTVEFWGHTKCLSHEVLTSIMTTSMNYWMIFRGLMSQSLPRALFVSLSLCWARNSNLFRIISVSRCCHLNGNKKTGLPY